MSRRGIFYILFFSVLAVSFFFILTRIVPGFGEKKLPPISYVQPFSFINQDGEKVTNADMGGKIYVANYFFTTCRGICPRMQGNMNRVYERFRNEADFRILSHTSDPDVDSVLTLKRYADSLGVSTSRWIFLTGRKDSLYTAARLSYRIDDPANNLKDVDDDFLHTQFFALVDKQGNVRKIYDGLKEEELDKLESDIEKLLKAN